jgi:uncharacterized protein (UPF0332 family)
MSWAEIGKDSLAAAKEIKHRSRSCLSRAYFAAFAAVTQALIDSKGVSFPVGREGPRHADILDLIKNHLGKQLGHTKIKAIITAMRRLRQIRILADYRASRNFKQTDVLSALRDATMVFKELL